MMTTKKCKIAKVEVFMTDSVISVTKPMANYISLIKFTITDTKGHEIASYGEDSVRDLLAALHVAEPYALLGRDVEVVIDNGTMVGLKDVKTGFVIFDVGGYTK